VEQSLNHYMLFHFQNRLLPNYTLYKHLFLRTLEGSKLSFQFPLYGREQLLLDATISKKRYGWTISRDSSLMIYFLHVFFLHLTYLRNRRMIPIWIALLAITKEIQLPHYCSKHKNFRLNCCSPFRYGNGCFSAIWP